METIRTAVVGLGTMGIRWHCDQLSRLDGFELVAGCDTTQERREIARLEFGIATFDDMQQILGRNDVDLITIATPSSMHHEHVLDVLGAGKHCVVEKPPAMNVAEWDDMVEAAGEANRTLSAYQNRRWDTDQLTALDLVRSGKFGEVFMIKSISMIWSDLMHTYAAEEYRPGWRAEKAYGGGALYDFGPHRIDQFLQLMGHERVVDVYADLRGRVWSDEVDDSALVILRFESGVTAQIEQTMAARSKLNTFMVVGSEATYQDGLLLTGGPGDLQEAEVEMIPEDWDQFYRQLHTHITTGTPPPVPVEETRQMLQVLQAAFESAESNEVVQI